MCVSTEPVGTLVVLIACICKKSNMNLIYKECSHYESIFSLSLLFNRETGFSVLNALMKFRLFLLVYKHRQNKSLTNICKKSKLHAN